MPSGFLAEIVLVSTYCQIYTIARRNELIRARRRGGLNASDVCGSWSTGRIFICERATVSERHTFTEARQLAAAHDVRRVWIRRGIIYFRIKDNALVSLHLPEFTSLHS